MIKFFATKMLSLPGELCVSHDGSQDRSIGRYIDRIAWSGTLAIVTIERPFRPRSTGEKSQNHHLNAHCQEIARETGNEFAEVKLAVKRRAIKLGLRLKDEGGLVTLSLLDGEPEPISEADMSVEECAWCIDAAHEIADFLGMKLTEE